MYLCVMAAFDVIEAHRGNIQTDGILANLFSFVERRWKEKGAVNAGFFNYAATCQLSGLTNI